MSSEKAESITKDVEAGGLARTASRTSDGSVPLGVVTVEASNKVYGTYSKWALFISLGLAAYIYSLDGTTTYTYLAYVTSSFERHAFIATIQVAQSIIVACGKPVIAKIADVGSRGTAYAFVLLFYVVGYIVIASANSVETVAGGIILYAIGYTGLQLLTQIIIADMTTLKWRGLVSGLISLPFVVNAFVGANISASILQRSGWRWGYGMFAILVPAALSPLIITLLWAERKARKLNLSPASSAPAHQESFVQRLRTTASRLDVIGLLLIGASTALILLPITLSKTATGGWNNASMIAMVTIGCVFIPAYVFYEFKFAAHPVVARRFVFNRSVVISCLVGAFDFVSFYISYTYLYSFVYVVKPWSLLNLNYFSQTQTVALTVFGIMGGVLMRFVHRSKPILVVGLAIRVLGCGLMIHSRGANASDVEIVFSQIIQGIGGGFAAVSLQVSAQAAVPHADVAVVTSLVLLITEIGGAIGTAISGGIWSHMMPARLAHHLPFLSDADRALLFGSIYGATQFPRGNPVREGVILAYDDVMKILTIVATVFGAVPLVISFWMPNWYLGDQQNAVDNVGLSGERVGNPDVDEEMSEKR
ncbi:hypothetical protein D9619_005131 [Psilocybe cf. subviscida]|uniref:Major facilitator superfamily (MFS) profile domain-containing protein n=1 Tax=Psilocybe cf. subviscida TaxID=2480587 RepID=A0A8H5BQ51_9AGAR|nr:hypothetical protein D9619_005131 [Psilocybe cf. subviscida]